MDGDRERTTEDPEEIDRIMHLFQGVAEKCPWFIDTPDMDYFRLDFFKNQELLASVGIAIQTKGLVDFITEDEDQVEWYFMRGLREPLGELVKNVPLVSRSNAIFKRIAP